MSINGMGSALPNLVPQRPDAAASAAQVAEQRARTGLAPQAPAPVTTPASSIRIVPGAPANVASAKAPEGTDPKLWSVLTSEERAFFAKASNGPLTYSRLTNPNRTSGPTPSMSIRGGRVDVRV
jgi:hypothetical protein